jgi:hypothetical protein
VWRSSETIMLEQHLKRDEGFISLPQPERAALDHDGHNFE